MDEPPFDISNAVDTTLDELAQSLGIAASEIKQQVFPIYAYYPGTSATTPSGPFIMPTGTSIFRHEGKVYKLPTWPQA